MTSFIAQLSDSHITTGPLGGGPAAGLQLALSRVMALDPLPDCVVITGDLTDHGRPDEYAALLEIIGSFPLPLHLTTGNHDDRGAMLDAVGGEAYYAVDYPEEAGLPSGARDRTTAYRYASEDEVLGTTLTEGGAVLGRSDATFDRLGRLRQQTTYLSGGLTPTTRWKMDQSTGPTVADSAGNNTGAVDKAVAWSNERGGSASFNGSAASIIGESPVNTQEPYTVSAWAKLAVKGAERNILIMPGDIGGPALKLFAKADDTWQIAMSVRNSDATTTSLSSSATVKATANAWTHLAVTVDPASANRTATLYVDGTATGTISTTKDFNNQAANLRIGSETDGDTGVFSGLIDDVQAYQKTLTPAEIGQLRSGTAPATDARVSRTTYGLTVDGSVKSVIDPRGNITYITNDAVGRGVVTISPPVKEVRGGGCRATRGVDHQDRLQHVR